MRAYLKDLVMYAGVAASMAFMPAAGILLGTGLVVITHW